MKNRFSDKDLIQIEKHGISLTEVESQIDKFRRGFAYLPIRRAATIGDGIIAGDPATASSYAEIYDTESGNNRIVKFVPASGAATRMFKDLFDFAATGKENKTVTKLLADIRDFAFYETIKENTDPADPKKSVQAVLDYGGELPKALILFHKYPDMARTPMDEHLAEGAMYAAAGGKVNIHFTISPEHEQGFLSRLSVMKDYFEKKYGVSYDISFSQQKSSTDTIAVTPENEPFREDDGSLLFRPAGHGALLSNLNDIDADIIFIKTIDNVAPDHLKADTVLYKKALAGILLSIRKKVFGYLETLDRGVSDAALSEISQFVREELYYELPSGFEESGEEEKHGTLRKILDRPIRVCGMVRNEGEPGGGPFWAANADGSVSLQIAESSQVAPGQKDLLENGTHFNPVDLVCGVSNYKGHKFDLMRYTDPDTGFTSEKSKNGRPLKAQELPGLWNGSMADWITVFAEVPISTFSPVKEVTDLLRPQHQ